MTRGSRKSGSFKCGWCEFPLRYQYTEPPRSCTRTYQRHCPICRKWTVLSQVFVVFDDAMAERLFKRLGIPVPEDMPAGEPLAN